MIGFATNVVALTLVSGREWTVQPCGSELEDRYLADLRDEDLQLNDPSALVRSIECLGTLRSIAAVNPLIELLDFPRNFWWDGIGAIRLVPLTGRYPAGGRLLKSARPPCRAFSRSSQPRSRTRSAVAWLRTCSIKCSFEIQPKA